MSKQSSLETLKCNTFDFESLLLDDNNDSGKFFFDESQFSDTNYFSNKEALLKNFCSESNSFSLLILTSKVLKKDFLLALDFEFKGIFSGLRQFLATENFLEIMKNAFYFTIKALFH